MTTTQALQIVAQALAAVAAACVAGVASYRKWVRPLLDAIHAQAAAANKAVNNVAVGDPTLMQRIGALEAGQVMILAAVERGATERAELAKAVRATGEHVDLIRALLTKETPK